MSNGEVFFRNGAEITKTEFEKHAGKKIEELFPTQNSYNPHQMVGLGNNPYDHANALRMKEMNEKSSKTS